MLNESVQILLLAAVLGALLVGLVRWDARRRGVIDQPNARSSHVAPTPRGGGLGLLVAFALGLAFAHSRGGGSLTLTAVLTSAAIAVVGAIGWIDDHGGAPVRLRLVVHLAAGFLLLPLALSSALPIPTGLAIVWWVFWTVSAVNVVNFVDGIDGIIGLQAAVYGGFVSLVGLPGGGVHESATALVGASVGFLLWNWNPARIFMGDVGSGALGVVFVALGAGLLAEGQVGFVAAFAPLAPMFLDASVTLVRRARRGERLGEAHRSHLYQRLANGGWGHARVAFLYAALSAAAAVGACLAPRGGALLLVALLVPLAVIGLLLERAATPTGDDPPMLP